MYSAPAMPPPPPYDWFPIALGLGLTVLLLCCCLVCWYAFDLPKIIAPRLRKRSEENVRLSHFMDEGNERGDMDPDLELNPVILARMEAERQQNRKRGGAGAGGAPRPGALARLGINFAPKGGALPQNKVGKCAKLKQVDVMIAKQAQQSCAPDQSCATSDGRARGEQPAIPQAKHPNYMRGSIELAAEKLAERSEKQG